MSPARKPDDASTYAGAFAARLRMLREKTGLTGQQFATRLSKAGYQTTATTYYRWETGESEPPLKAFVALARALGLNSPRSLLPKVGPKIMVHSFGETVLFTPFSGSSEQEIDAPDGSVLSDDLKHIVLSNGMKMTARQLYLRWLEREQEFARK